MARNTQQGVSSQLTLELGTLLLSQKIQLFRAALVTLRELPRSMSLSDDREQYLKLERLSVSPRSGFLLSASHPCSMLSPMIHTRQP